MPSTTHHLLRFSTVVTSAYLHLPFCLRRCFYCDFPITVTGEKQTPGIHSQMEEYSQWLCREIKSTPILGGALQTIFFGGGTPSLFPVDLLEEVLQTLDQRFGIATDAEISLEIDPGTFSWEQLIRYKALGISRVSLGVQAFQDRLLEKCGRSHRVSNILTACDQIQRSAIAWSLDLISGLPEQTLEDWHYSLEQAIALGPNHISSYDLVVEPQTPFGKQYEPGEKPLPSDENTAAMYSLASETLRQGGGYEHYEISNYAQPGYQCRHNRVYWENLAYYGFGMGAASFTQNQRFSRPRTRATYFDWVRAYEQTGGVLDVVPLTKGDRLLETLMLGLRLTEGLALSQLAADFGQANVEHILKILKPAFQKQWAQISKTDSPRLFLSDPDGLLFSNTILADLFHYLEPEKLVE